MKLLVTGGSGFIGTNLIDHLIGKVNVIVNVDNREPMKPSHSDYWRKCDILHKKSLIRLFAEVEPRQVVHLAARTDMIGNSLDDYMVNTEGTSNVLEAVTSTASVRRVIITSSQFVCKPGKLPSDNNDFAPHTIYGHSKAIAEKLTRESNQKCVWTIVRPTNIWGPWHPRYPYEFWRVLAKGWYFHPDSNNVIRSYGYVGNVVHQIWKILLAPPEIVNSKVYYLGDMPISLLDWVNGFSRALTGSNVRVVPRYVLRSLALFGDILSIFGVSFPIHSSRFRSMTEDYITPMQATLDAFGKPPFSLEKGIMITASWLKSMGFVRKIYTQ